MPLFVENGVDTSMPVCSPFYGRLSSLKIKHLDHQLCSDSAAGTPALEKLIDRVMNSIPRIPAPVTLH